MPLPAAYMLTCPGDGGDARCEVASLFPSLRPTDAWEQMERAFAVEPKSLLGAQALLLRRRAIARAVEEWRTVAGMQSQRLAQLFGAKGPIWVHDPSLVQHVADDSSWGSRGRRGLLHPARRRSLEPQ